MTRLRTLRAQAAEELRALIDSDYSPGDRLPAEAELAKRIGLSRNTVREAVALLVSEGLVQRRWGVGTTVLAPVPPASFSVTDIIPVKEIIKGAGHEPGLSHWHHASLRPAPDIAAHLDLPEDKEAETWYVERVFTVDGRPAVHLRDWCLKTIGGRPVDLTRLRDVEVDFIGLLREQSGEILHRMEGKLQGALSGEAFATPANPGPVPLVQITQTCYTTGGSAVVYSIVQFDTSVVDLTIRRAFTGVEG
ncbi:GntR family transcriptional regulator [Streptomyces sp. SID7909]|uniref:GntR family transcriptional regulator n=1 Tax=Streptomyces sp. SID7909 TaxID=2706092 RepID=UPI0013B72875|nr:GntR family transcriptional regulator [Streptomyces sp. SID7909]NEC06568.1 GntR family transcriptional regulator [Streptomyces sp. SID7909]